MRRMSAEEAFNFLSEGTRTGKISTVRADGRPHVTPIWFVIEDGSILFTTWHTRFRPTSPDGSRPAGLPVPGNPKP